MPTNNKDLLPNSAAASEANAPIYLLHIPKTGGSTVRAFLQTVYAESEFWNYHGILSWRALFEYPLNDLRRCSVITGHFCAYFFRYFSSSLRYITFLRDPVTRALSHYNHVRRSPDHYLHEIAIQFRSFGEYIRDERTQPTIANFQLRSLGSTLDPAEIAKDLTADDLYKDELERRLEAQPFQESVDDLYKTAIARLEQMAFVGVTERLDDSINLLCEIFQWPTPESLNARNKAPNPLDVKSIPGADLKLLRQLNEADIELHEFARRMLERQWSKARFVYPRLHAFVSFAQNCEDVLLHRALGQIPHGFYVDVGANDPSGDSVTKAFYDKGWRGLNIEPVPSLYERLVRERIRDVNLQCATGSAEGSAVLHEIPGTGLSTMDESVARRHEAHGFPVRKTSVSIRTLDVILKGVEFKEIHFLKIDVEGWERETLLGLNLKSIRPFIIVVEATEPNSQVSSHETWEGLITSNEYTFAFFDGLNRYYVSNENMALKDKIAIPANSGDCFIRASEAGAMKALRKSIWENRRSSIDYLHSYAESARARESERADAVVQIEALRQWATSADAYGRSLLVERDSLRESLELSSRARESERADAVVQIEALRQWATSADAYGKSLLAERDALLEALDASSRARASERSDAIAQIDALRQWATSADTYGRSLLVERDALRELLDASSRGRDSERADATQKLDIELGKIRVLEGLLHNAETRIEALEIAFRESEGSLAELRRNWVVRFFVRERLSGS